MYVIYIEYVTRLVEATKACGGDVHKQSQTLDSVTAVNRFAKLNNKLTEGRGGRLKIERLADTMKMFFHRPLSGVRFVCETKFPVFPSIYASLRFSLGGENIT